MDRKPIFSGKLQKQNNTLGVSNVSKTKVNTIQPNSKNFLFNKNSNRICSNLKFVGNAKCGSCGGYK